MQIDSNNMSDMMKTQEDSNNSGLSPVSQMFYGRSVFITGASGFIGRVLVEKLLRSYPGIKNIYILMRSKKSHNPYDRLHKQVLSAPIFDHIRSMDNGKQLLDKIVVVAGDIAMPKLGISDEDMATLLADETLSIIFHSAATIKFDEPIRQSVLLNLCATKDIIDMCKQLPNLVGVCHVSTAFVNSDILDESDIKEELYPIKDDPNNLIKLSELMDENLMQGLKVNFVGKRPNTYTYTKALAEHLIANEAADLPITIVRPSIVTGAWKEPLIGWVDNLNGPTGLVLAAGKGLMRSLLAVRSVRADIIPVDVVVNTMIASTFYTAKVHNKLDFLTGEQESCTTLNSAAQTMREATPKKTITSNNQQNNKTNSSCSTEEAHNEAGDTEDREISSQNQQNTDNNQKQPHIVHCASGDVKPLYWGSMEDMFNVVRKYPSIQVLRYPFGTFKSNKYHDIVARLFAHYLPALIIDMICGLLGKKRQLLRVYNKLHSATAALAHFCTNNYYFKVENIRKVEAALSGQDKQDLYMDISSIDWTKYFDDYCLGARRYVLKEPDDNLAEARRLFRRAYYIEITLRVLLAAMLLAVLLPYTMRLATTYPIRVALQTLNISV